MRVLFPWHINRSCANLSDFFMRCANCAVGYIWRPIWAFEHVWACLSVFERVWAFISFICSWIGLNRIESDWIGLNRAWNMQLSWSLDTLNMMTWFNPRCQSHLNPLPVNLVGIVVLHARLSGLMWFDVVWCGLMWFDVVWCGLMWFVMQSRHIQNQPKKKHPFWWAGGPQRRSYLWRSRNQSLAT